MSDPMIATPTLFPSQEEGLSIHRRLLEGDPIAPSDLAALFLGPLADWLIRHNRRSIDPDFCVEAAEETVLALIHNPASWNPGRQGLPAYLRMAAHRDLLNILARESRHRRGRQSLEAVELSSHAGKYLGQEDDPSRHLQLEEAVREARNGIPASLREGLTAQERVVLDLMLQGERKTEFYARACGIGHLSIKEQRREVKRVKERLQKRWDRARASDD
jgi:hypothetical protein